SSKGGKNKHLLLLLSLIKPTVTLQPSWTQIYSGETVTVRCEIQGGEGAQWTYEWRAAKLNTPPTSNEYRIIRATESDSGGYSCRGRRDYFFSEWSDIITLTVSCKIFHPEYLNKENSHSSFNLEIETVCKNVLPTIHPLHKHHGEDRSESYSNGKCTM
uniref:Ig-like domain-containing protein n=1 Tax=Maylandia zebra TaxID=106582 RepID=A0A3P9DUU1_9CICH